MKPIRTHQSSRVALGVLLFSAGCASIFDIEAGTYDPDDSEAGSGGDTGGLSGAAGRGGSSGADTGGTGPATGGTDTGGTGPTGGTSGKGGSAGSGGKGGSAGSAGKGGSAGSAGKGGSAGSGGSKCECTPGSTSDTLLISNFENGGGAVLPHAGRVGGFWTTTDGRSSTISFEDQTVTPTCTGDDGNCYEMCVSGEIGGSAWPFALVGVGLDAASNPPLAYDVTAYSGISFRLHGIVGQNSVLMVEASTLATSPAVYGGTCVPSGTLGCDDHYKTSVAVTHDVETREIRFFELGQGPGGGQWSAPFGVPALWDDQVLNLTWVVKSTIENLSQPESFEFCIDDVKFLPALTPTQTIDFETSTDGFAILPGAPASTTLGISTAQHHGGTHSLELGFNGSSDPVCSGVPTACSQLTMGACINGCTWSGSACTGTPTPCAQLAAPCSDGCVWNNGYTFALTDPDIEPGDTVTFHYRLPPGGMHWLNVFVADDLYQWRSITIGGNSRRGEWLYGGFTVPDDIDLPIRQLGFQFAAPPNAVGTFYLDDISW